MLGAAGVAPLSVAPETFELTPPDVTPEERLEGEMLDWLTAVFVTGARLEVVGVVVAVLVDGEVAVSVGVSVAVAVEVAVSVAVALDVAVAVDVAVSVTVTVGVGVVMTTGADTTTASSPQAVATLLLFELELVKAAVQL